MDNDMPAILGQRAHQRRADAFGTAGDDSGLVAERFHGDCGYNSSPGIASLRSGTGHR
jgi:hypothetical protein